MSGEIEIADGTASKVVEVILNQPTPSGWIAWYRMTPHSYFSQVYPDYDYAHRDFFKCPSPLFLTREEAIDAARKLMRNEGGELRVVKVTL